MKLRELKEAFFPSKRPSLEDELVRRDESAQSIVALQARGNLSLQKGNILTAEDMETERKEVAKLEF